MSDYTPIPPDPARDPRTGDTPYRTGSRRGFGLLIGILVAIALVGGLLYFTSHRGPGRVEQAQAPVERTVPAPAQPPAGPTTPATPR